jgi:hypothetical protein
MDEALRSTALVPFAPVLVRLASSGYSAEDGRTHRRRNRRRHDGVQDGGATLQLGRYLSGTRLERRQASKWKDTARQSLPPRDPRRGRRRIRTISSTNSRPAAEKRPAAGRRLIKGSPSGGPGVIVRRCSPNAYELPAAADNRVRHRRDLLVERLLSQVLDERSRLVNGGWQVSHGPRCMWPIQAYSQQHVDEDEDSLRGFSSCN